MFWWNWAVLGFPAQMHECFCPPVDLHEWTVPWCNWRIPHQKRLEWLTAFASSSVNLPSWITTKKTCGPGAERGIQSLILLITSSSVRLVSNKPGESMTDTFLPFNIAWYFSHSPVTEENDICHSLSPSALCFPAHIWFSCFSCHH